MNSILKILAARFGRRKIMFDFNFNGKDDAFDSFIGYNMVFGDKEDNFEVDDWDKEDDSEEDDLENEDEDDF
jgi:chromatin remodeling complex protein RSC6